MRHNHRLWDQGDVSRGCNSQDNKRTKVAKDYCIDMKVENQPDNPDLSREYKDFIFPQVTDSTVVSEKHRSYGSTIKFLR